MRDPLPVDDYLPAITGHLGRTRAVVVTAAPGAGKTTRVPPALSPAGPVLLLQPRRVAARAIARRIAEEQGWSIGREVGWHVRFDRRDSAETRLLVATEGILTARLQQDPLLSHFRTVVLDEFHERSIHADLGIALVRQAWLARDDLRIVVMSATMNSARVSAFLNDCPIVDVPGRLFPIDVTYRPGVSMEDAVADVIRDTGGAVLGFLPGAAEIRRAAGALQSRLGGEVVVHQLHGSLDADAQDAALAPSRSPRVVLSTNIAETTLTVPDVSAVVDGGWQKVARYDAERALDSLETERISQDSADQRAGRAGRVAAGQAVRLWDSRDRLRPHREPDIARVDLAAPVMDILAWGGDPRSLEWFEAPPAGALDRAIQLLIDLGAVDKAIHLTAIGRSLRLVPLHPRLGRLLIEARAAPAAALACALLSERHVLPPAHGATACDLLAAVDRARDLPSHVRRVADDIRRTAAGLPGADSRSRIDDNEFRRAVLAAYPDRVARRRAAGSDRFLLASGTGARLGRESGVVSAEFIVAVDVGTSHSNRPGPQANEALIRIATGVERDWLVPTAVTVVHRFDAATGRVRATSMERVGEVTIRERDAPVDPQERARLLGAARLERGPSDSDTQLLRRLELVGGRASFASLVELGSARAESLDAIDLAAHLPADTRRRLDREVPERMPLPSGRTAALEYREDGRVVASVKLQELFGLADTPRVGPARTPVTFQLLAPNGRPVQVTTDLRSFWTTGYQEVRKELRARYPKHPWPDDPWTATPTHRTRRR
jgi:ATP-dependent helicase HrpB